MCSIIKLKAKDLKQGQHLRITSNFYEVVSNIQTTRFHYIRVRLGEEETATMFFDPEEVVQVADIE
jgi:RecB family endonuclease NucS